MVTFRNLQLSFAGGEVSPGFIARVDARQYQNAARNVQNWLPRPQGSLRSRPSFKHVAPTINAATNECRIFGHNSSSGSYVIEIGYDDGFGTYATMHKDGEPFRYATTAGLFVQSTTTIITGTPGSITFPYPHRLPQNTAVRISSTGTMPTGLTQTATYYVLRVDTFTIRVEASVGGGAVNITGIGSGTLRIFRLDKLFAQDWHAPLAIVEANWTNVGGKLTATSTAHGFRNGERKRMTTATTLPTGLALGTDYFVVTATANTFQLSATQSGTAIDFTDDGTGTHTVHSRYPNGSVVYSPTTVGDFTHGNFYYCYLTHTATATPSSANWIAGLRDGHMRVPFANANYGLNGHIDEINVKSMEDRLRVSHRGYPMQELRGPIADALGPLWTISTITLGPTLAASTLAAVTVDRGVGIQILQTLAGSSPVANTVVVETLGLANGLAIGDSIIAVDSTFPGIVSGERYIVDYVSTPSRFQLRTMAGAIVTNTTFGYYTGTIYYIPNVSESSQVYVVTAVDKEDVEGLVSNERTADNILSGEGAKNSLSWTAVVGAEAYRIYKKQNGLFGFIGETTTTTFVDNNIGPDLGKTPPRFDTTLNTGYPQAHEQFEQRLAIAGSYSYPQGVWLSRSGTDTDFTYSLPIQDDDRIFAQIASIQAQTIRHLVAIGDLVALTNRGAWRIAGPNGQVLTPATISIRSQSEIGASFVQPVIAGNGLVYEAARGGHLQMFGFQWQRQGYSTTDLSLRAAHLFDGLTIKGLAYQRSPDPGLWAVSSQGRLIYASFAPEEEVLGYSRVEGTGLIFDDVCCVEEGGDDAVYVLVRRGSTRYVARLQSSRIVTNDTAANLDLYVTSTPNVFTEGWPTSMVIDKLTTLSVGSTVRVRAVQPSTTTAEYGFAPQDVGALLSFTEGRVVRITTYESYSSVLATIVSGIDATDVGIDLPTIAFGRKNLYGLDHFSDGTSLTVLADGVVKTATVSGGAVSLLDPAFYIHAGLPYTCLLETLPVAVQIDGLGQGRTKNIGEVYLRLSDTATGITLGPDTGKLVPIETLTSTSAGREHRTLLEPKWGTDGSIVVQQSQPYSATLLGLTAQVTLGG